MKFCGKFWIFLEVLEGFRNAWSCSDRGGTITNCDFNNTTLFFSNEKNRFHKFFLEK